jgi:hypothetical protein
MNRAFRHILYSIFLFLPMMSAARAALPAPEGDVLLVIKGSLKAPNAGAEAHLDLALLESLPLEKFTTNTPWSDDISVFEGVRLNVILDAVGAESDSFKAFALDDYVVEFADVDLEKYPVIIAFRQNGKNLTVRKLGPLRIMFPFDDFPELLTQSNKTMSVWQLNLMAIH